VVPLSGAGQYPRYSPYRLGAEHYPKDLEESRIVEAIAKPFRRETLLNAMAKVLNHKENNEIV
jgi:hypothetical protein